MVQFLARCSLSWANSVIMTAILDWHHHIRPSKTEISPDNITMKNCCQTGHDACTPAMTREIGPMGKVRLNLRGWTVPLAGDHGLASQCRKLGSHS